MRNFKYSDGLIAPVSGPIPAVRVQCNYMNATGNNLSLSVSALEGIHGLSLITSNSFPLWSPFKSGPVQISQFLIMEQVNHRISLVLILDGFQFHLRVHLLVMARTPDLILALCY
jgi:hypothetical protein